MTAPSGVPYEGMACPHCEQPLTLLDRGATCEVFCELCGVVESRRLSVCRGRTCGTRLFFGGKAGKTPISVHTGSNHFLDCNDSGRFRRQV